MVGAICNYCGVSFQIKPYKLLQSRVYCSRKCKHLGLVKRETRVCMYCSSNITRRPSAFRKFDTYFCSHLCSAKFRAEQSIENTKNSIRFSSYTETSKERKARVYGNTCAICGFDRAIEYCHVIAASRGGSIHPDNIVPLCPNHHTLMDRDMLNEHEQDVIDDYLIRAWASKNSLVGKK